MSTTTISLDTNVVIALLNQDKDISRSARNAIDQSRKSGRLVVSGPVYAELLGLPSRTQQALDEFFRSGHIEVDWRFEEAVWRAAGVAYQGYVRRRLASTGTLPRRILTDFLIGAHASLRNYTLLTLDGRLYGVSFPGIRIESF
jgi:predicted nucleic acid-binding protein